MLCAVCDIFASLVLCLCGLKLVCPYAVSDKGRERGGIPLFFGALLVISASVLRDNVYLRQCLISE